MQTRPVENAAVTLPQPTGGIAFELLHQGSVNADINGTILDVIYCLCDDITDPSNIKETDTTNYILAPASFAEPPAKLENQIKAALAAINRVGRDGFLGLMIPIQHDDQLWSLLNIWIENGQIQSAMLWDATHQNEETDCYCTPPQLLTLQNIIENITHDTITPVNLFSLQTDNEINAYASMDEAIQQAYASSGITNAITNAEHDIKKRRLAVVSKIARNHPELGVYASMQLKAIEDNKIIWRGHKNYTAPTIQDDRELFYFLATTQNKRLRDKFDTLVASRLQLRYNQCQAGEESELTKQSLAEAMQAFGVFAKRTNSTVADANNEPQMQAQKWYNYL